MCMYTYIYVYMYIYIYVSGGRARRLLRRRHACLFPSYVSTLFFLFLILLMYILLLY